MTATLMMVTFNRLDLTQETLESLFKNTNYPFNLVIVDNGSEDGTVSYLDKTLYQKTEQYPAFQDYKVRINKNNLGIAVGRNMALYDALTGYDPTWLGTIDNDVGLPSGWLGECIDIMTHNPEFAAIGVNMEGKIYPEVTKHGKVFQEKPQGNLGTAAMVFPRSLQKMLGYFNHRDYKFYAHEDADWGMRVRALGFKMGYISEMGQHLGEGERDQGEYRKFKDQASKDNLPKFYQNSRDYLSKRKSLYIPFDIQEYVSAGRQ